MRVFLAVALVACFVFQIQAKSVQGECQPGCMKKISQLETRLSALERERKWNLVFRGSKGFGANFVAKWEDNHPYNENKARYAKNLQRKFNNLYKSAIVGQWGTLNIQEVKLSLYNKGKEVAFFVFDGRRTTKMDWFSKDKLLRSSYNNLLTSTFNFFSIKGDDGWNRHFFVSKSYGGCPNDLAWSVVVDDGNTACDWMKKEAAPYFLYCPNQGPCKLESEAVIADTLAIFIRQGKA